MAFWNSRDDDDEAAEAKADELESAATGMEPVGARERRRGFYASPIGLIVAAVVVVLALLFFTPMHGPWPGAHEEPSTPGGDAVFASQRLADIAAEQQLADARALGWQETPAIDAHVGTFAAQTPPR